MSRPKDRGLPRLQPRPRRQTVPGAGVGSVLYTGLLPQTQTLLAAMNPTPSGALATAIDTAIATMIVGGAWDTLDILYVLAAESAANALLNWKNPGTFTASAVNAPTFTQFRGYAGDGATSYVDSLWNFSTNGVRYTQNSAAVWLWNLTEGQSGTSVLGTQNGANVSILPRNASNQTTWRINNGTAGAVANSVAAGMFTACRAVSTTIRLYKNGVQLGTAAQTSAAPVSQTLTYNKVGGAFSTLQGAMFGASGNLTNTANAAAYSAMQGYMTFVGAA